LSSFADLFVDQSQLLQRHLQQPRYTTFNSVQAPSASHNCSGVARQAFIRQSGQSGWVGFTFGERLQHPPGTEAEQIGDEAGQLDMCLFQKRLQLVLQPHPIAPNWYFLRVTSATDVARHRAQSSKLIAGHQPLHQAFGIGKIPLASPSSAIG